MKIGKVEQTVEHPRIPKVNFRRFHLAFPDILMPRLELPDHKSSGQDIEIRAHGLVGQSHGATQLRGIPGLSVIVGQHGPEAMQGFRDQSMLNVCFLRTCALMSFCRTGVDRAVT
jgi:hypothetical protein